jgi:hypothetical protein
MRGDLSGPAGEAVASGTRKGRPVRVGPERLSEHTAEGLVETHTLDAQTAGAGANTSDLGSVNSDQRGGLVKT